MKYILEGHEMKHAAEEMLLHLLPTETLTRSPSRTAVCAQPPA